MSQVLVVTSKVKAFIKEKADMNTAATVSEALTKIVEKACLKAIENAKGQKRKTVMEKDFEF